MAACYLTTHEFPELLYREAVSDLERWREAVPLAIARAGSVPDAAWRCVAALLPEPDPELAGAALRALVCARGVVERSLHVRVEARYEGLLERVRASLLETCEKGWLSVHDRAEAGDLLGQLGDPRLETESWIRVPAGNFLMGAQGADAAGVGFDPDAADNEAPVRELELAEYELPRFAVTVGQYACFVDDGGYKQNAHWDAAGWEASQDAGWDGPEDFAAQRAFPTRPVVGVSFYEASAYARYRGFRLPSEAEWEKAARHPDGRRYPWRSDFGTERCNNRDCGLYRVAAVGIFPRGRSELGFDDLSGNVWEWCADPYDAYDAVMVSDPSHPTVGSQRVIRGGAWFNVARDVRAATRFRIVPEYRYGNLGFRLARGQ